MKKQMPIDDFQLGQRISENLWKFSSSRYQAGQLIRVVLIFLSLSSELVRGDTGVAAEEAGHV